jgi:hypothetical protein
VSRSLQFRLAWRLAVVFAMVILGTSLAILLHRGGGHDALPDDELMEAIDRVKAGLSVGPDGRPRLDLPADPGFDYAVATSAGTTLFASPAPPSVPSPAWTAGLLRQGDKVAAFRQAETAAGPVTIRVAIDCIISRAGSPCSAASWMRSSSPSFCPPSWRR